MREGTNEGTNEQTNERTFTTTKHITTLLLRSRVKKCLLLDGSIDIFNR